jgi:Endonuclease-reverse transcriptase
MHGRVRQRLARFRLIINVYNAHAHNKDNSAALQAYISNLNKDNYDLILIGGDFNLHHPLWNPTSYHGHDDEADILIDALTHLNLSLLLPPGTITYPNAKTTIDLVWGNKKAAQNLIACTTSHEHDVGSDHLPIQTVISVTTQPTPVQYAYNFDKTDWETLKTKVTSYLPNLQTPNNPTDLNKYATDIVNAILQAINDTTPRKQPCPHSKRWWKPELTKLRKQVHRLRNRTRRRGTEQTQAAWRRLNAKYV